jgi:hypothetical protein
VTDISELLRIGRFSLEFSRTGYYYYMQYREKLLVNVGV